MENNNELMDSLDAHVLHLKEMEAEDEAEAEAEADKTTSNSSFQISRQNPAGIESQARRRSFLAFRFLVGCIDDVRDYPSTNDDSDFNFRLEAFSFALSLSLSLSLS